LKILQAILACVVLILYRRVLDGRTWQLAYSSGHSYAPY